jgi:hypothetical protein
MGPAVNVGYRTLCFDLDGSTPGLLKRGSHQDSRIGSLGVELEVFPIDRHDDWLAFVCTSLQTDKKRRNFA